MTNANDMAVAVHLPSGNRPSERTGKLCWAGFVTGKPYVEVMVRREGGSVDQYVVYLDGQRESAHPTPHAAMEASKAHGYVNHGPTLESSMGG
jgi:hypothetical protein